ncbi:rifampicin phosphotransferase isoform X1 [Megachile rotundata]|uniref:rifampicin phosphotransferase isoform X1 n=2 Tax=Megachile rotundata TaxID=143995 RepID=UPI003FD4AAB4
MANILFVIQILSLILITLKFYSWIKAINKRKLSRFDSNDTKLDLYFLLKHWWAEFCVTVSQRRHGKDLHTYKKDVQKCFKNKDEEVSNNSVLFYGTDQKGNCLFIKFSHRKFQLAEVSLQLNTSDGQLYVLPNYPDTTLINGLNQEWTAGGLKIEFLEFQKRWRIVYNGMLRNLARGGECSSDNIEHVRLNFLFIANIYPLRWPEDWSSKLHADALAREPWNLEWTNKIKLFANRGFDQMGSMIGQVTYKGASVSTMYLRGLHQHRWGKDEFHESATLFVVMPLGDIYYLGVGTTKQSFPRIHFGQFRHSNDEEYQIDTMDFRLSDFTRDNFNSSSTYKLGFEARGTEYNIVVSGSDPITFYHGQPWNWQNKIATVKLEVNGKSGTGLIQLWSPYSGPCDTKVPKQLELLKQPNTSVQKSNYVIYFNDEKCRNENIVGGKGFSLAVLTSIEDAQFVVPKGFCVTIFALELQLHAHKELQKIIRDIEDVSVGIKDGDLQRYCNEAMDIIQSTPLIEKVRNAILKAIENLESEDDDKSPRYAIRSSAVGEDSEETSAAGQNSTYLGVRGTENIIKCIAMCWASLFSYQSVNYRKQHGMFIKTSMGVCVQKMINPDTAGVMFTRHPTTGDPSNIIITANYGLGETVVSASVEPDTIVVHKSWDNKLTVQSSTVGNKNEKMLASDDGVVSVKLNNQESKTICLSDSVALRLAAIGINLETLFGSARDIEWAVIDEQIYLLQARPITTLYTWTEFELIHELDSGVPSDVDINVFGNVGEVFPNPISPLSISVLPSVFNEVFNRGIQTKNQICFNMFGMRATINYYATFLQKPVGKITLLNKVIDIAVNGKVVLTPELHKIVCEKNGLAAPGFQIRAIFKMAREAIQNSAIERMAKVTCKKFNLKAEDFNTAYSLYNEIVQQLEDTYKPIVDYHTHASRVSITYQIMAMALLTSGYTDIVPEHFSDIALLFGSSNDIVGTKILTSLKKFITRIKENKKDEEFRKVEPTNGIDWLKINCPSAAEELDNFLKEHGHRCIQEMDFISEPWSLRPENLIATLQTMIVTPEANTSTKTFSVDETVALLKTPKSPVSKWLLRKITPFCRKAVARREITKSIFVNIIHTLRLAYKRLGKLMVLEEYLPSEDLIFFLTNEEIEQILSHRNATLVQKAYRRKRVFPKLKEYIYPEFNTGMVLPIKENLDVPISDGNVKIEGTSVYSGSILGRACVITDVSEAKTIQHGDILITYSTDIAWSPYFSLLSGIVTELGGLISHGAVIAREYGLPCIIGAKMATRLFQTGDTVLLQADIGTLQLVKKHE